MQVRLGRVPSVPDRRDRRLASYLAPGPIRGSPLELNWTETKSGLLVPFSTFDNDKIGNCTCAAFGHIEEAAAVHSDRESSFTAAKVNDGYSVISNYPTEDVGASCRDALKYFKATGDIELYGRINVSRFHIQAVVDLCGGVYVGADLPLSAQDQYIWDVAPANQWTEQYRRRSWGGHAMALLGYDHTHVWFVTWGRVKKATWSWVFTYVEEAWFAISPLWTADDVLTPGGIMVDELRADVVRLAA